MTTIRAAEKRRPFEVGTQLGLLMLGLEFLDLGLRLGLDRYGILPRSQDGIVGIFVAPALHAGFGHLFSNLLPFWALSFFLFSDRAYRPYQTLAWIWVGAGLGTWAIGRAYDQPSGLRTTHIGASSLIYGMVAYLIVAGLAMRRWRPIAVSVIVFGVFGSIFYGVLPRVDGVSWEAHLSSALAGLSAAIVLHRRPSRPPIRRARG